MPTVTFITVAGDSRNVDVPGGDSLMECAVRDGIPGIVVSAVDRCRVQRATYSSTTTSTPTT